MKMDKIRELKLRQVCDYSDCVDCKFEEEGCPVDEIIIKELGGIK